MRVGVQMITAIAIKNLKIKFRSSQTYIYAFGFPMPFSALKTHLLAVHHYPIFPKFTIVNKSWPWNSGIDNGCFLSWHQVHWRIYKKPRQR